MDELRKPADLQTIADEIKKAVETGSTLDSCEKTLILRLLVDIRNQNAILLNHFVPE